MRNRLVPLLLSLVVAAGCTPAAGWTAYGLSDKGPDDDQKALIQKESARYRGRGNSSIVGRVYLTSPDGRQIMGNQEPVYLTPVTTWAESRVVDVLTANEIPQGDARAAQVWWTGKVDASGRFSFGELVDGEYFVLSPVQYTAGGDARTAIAVARVRIAPGQTANIDVTRKLEQQQ